MFVSFGYMCIYIFVCTYMYVYIYMCVCYGMCNVKYEGFCVLDYLSKNLRRSCETLIQ